jgi:hypothetical protein
MQDSKKKKSSVVKKWLLGIHIIGLSQQKPKPWIFSNINIYAKMLLVEMYLFYSMMSV